MNPQLKEKYFTLLTDMHANDEQLSSYNDCPHDSFMGNGTRYKRFSQYKVTHKDGGWKLTLLPARAYTAFKKFNTVGGGFSRPYEAMEADFTPFITRLINGIDLDRNVSWQINVHQNRSIADPERNGQLTPEGRHMDGHEFVSISVFTRSNIQQGRTRLWSDADSLEPIWEREMQPGETVLLYDEKIMHDVTDIEPVGNERGSRDILIVAYSRWEERWYGNEHDNVALEVEP